MATARVRVRAMARVRDKASVVFRVRLVVQKLDLNLKT